MFYKFRFWGFGGAAERQPPLGCAPRYGADILTSYSLATMQQGGHGPKTGRRATEGKEEERGGGGSAAVLRSDV